MEKGPEGLDIGSARPDRFLFTWDALAHIPNDIAVSKYEWYLRTHRWQKAVACWEIFPLMSKWLWDIVWRHSVKLDVVTFNGEQFAAALQRRFDEQQLPVNHTLSMQPDELAKELAVMPDVRRVYFGNPEDQFKYGPRGEFVPRFGEGFDPYR
jgi:hypothetical protein